MEHISKVFQNKTVSSPSFPVNSSKKNSLSTVNGITVNSYEQEEVRKITAFLESEHITPQGIAQTIAEGLDDHKSLDYWLLVVKNNNPAILLETLHYVKDRAKSGLIRTTKAIYYHAILKRKGLITKFRGLK